jgi:hypothetical protein
MSRKEFEKRNECLTFCEPAKSLEYLSASEFLKENEGEKIVVDRNRLD